MPRATVKRGQMHRDNVNAWIATLQDGGTVDYIPTGVEFLEHTGFDESVRDQIIGMNGDVLLGYLIAMNQREEIRAK